MELMELTVSFYTLEQGITPTRYLIWAILLGVPWKCNKDGTLEIGTVCNLSTKLLLKQNRSFAISIVLRGDVTWA